MDTDWQIRLQDALEPLPTREGGITIVLATAAAPPALAMLSSGDVLLKDGTVRAGVWATSSVVSRLGGAFSLLVPAGDVALRVEANDAGATTSGDVALIEGTLADVRPTAEPPWTAFMRFGPSDPSDERIDAHLAYWTSVRSWLRDDGPAPTPPS